MKKLKVALVGEPNAGKSTLANLFIKKKICVESIKPHSTREPTLAIYTDSEYQIVFTDTPGISRTNQFHHLSQMAMDCIYDVDLVIFLIDATKKIPEKLLDIGQNVEKKIALITKIDLVNKGRLLPLTAELSKIFKSVFSMSSKSGPGFNLLLTKLKEESYEGEWDFAPIHLTNRSEQSLIKDRVKEVLFQEFNKELPYDLVVDIEEIVNKSKEKYIYLNIICQPSHKPIVLSKIKQVSIAIRKNIEQFLECKVHSFINIKVSKKAHRSLL